MMNVNEIQGFHIELTNMCTLKCPGCARTQFIKQWPQHWQNHNLNIDDLFNFLDVDLNNKVISLCGNLGDPIYHPQIIEIVQEFKIRNAIISMKTNGSYKSQNWWQKICTVLDKNDEIIFGIDGLPDTFTKYRINADWKSIETAIKVVAEHSVAGKWQFIPFAYNEHQIKQAEELAKQLGMDDFIMRRSDRFDDSTRDFQPVNVELLGFRYEKQHKFKNGEFLKVNPKCANKIAHYISANGFYSPCCYIADHRFYYKTQFGKDKKHYNINNTTITQLLTKPEVVDFYNNLQNTSACQYNCPKI